MANVPGHDPAKRGAFSGATPHSIETRLDYLAHKLPELSSLTSFSGVIALQSGDGPITQVCHPKDLFSPDPSFNVYSIGKLFTAVAVMQLIEDGIREGRKISLDTKLSDLLTPEECTLSLREPYEGEKPSKEALQSFAAHAGEITLKHLLSHSAGFKGEGGRDWSKDQIGKYAYSNYSFQLLARIIGKHSKEYGNPEDYETGFRNHIEKRIFCRAEMVGAMHEPQHPKSHEPNPSEGVPEPSYFQVLENGSREKITAPAPYPHGNGCWRMKASDLILFGKAIRRHSLITEQSQRAMLDHRPSIGFMAFDRGSVKSWGHPGGWMGQSGFLHVWLTDPPITAVVLSENSTTPETMQPFLDKEFNQ